MAILNPFQAALESWIIVVENIETTLGILCPIPRNIEIKGSLTIASDICLIAACIF